MKLMHIAALLVALVAGPLFAAEPVNINTAGADVLAERLHNVGPVKAEAIVSYRDDHGDFESIEALVDVTGIGLSTVEDNRELMTVDSTAPQGTR